MTKTEFVDFIKELGFTQSSESEGCVNYIYDYKEIIRIFIRVYDDVTSDFVKMHVEALNTNNSSAIRNIDKRTEEVITHFSLLFIPVREINIKFESVLRVLSDLLYETI